MYLGWGPVKGAEERRNKGTKKRRRNNNLGTSWADAVPLEVGQIHTQDRRKSPLKRGLNWTRTRHQQQPRDQLAIRPKSKTPTAGQRKKSEREIMQNNLLHVTMAWIWVQYNVRTLEKRNTGGRHHHYYHHHQQDELKTSTRTIDWFNQPAIVIAKRKRSRQKEGSKHWIEDCNRDNNHTVDRFNVANNTTFQISNKTINLPPLSLLLRRKTTF
jgi:hypothetical protein